ncbi:MAG TPA: hypothetical protein VE974_06980 [Thermoanaerobaculia bacterium]|nr:hypothetical protein [Thermoanaerobaculia bacterium]
MNTPFVIAAVLTAVVGVVHSYLGERYILMRLFRRGNLPDLFRKHEFTKRTLRLAWHVTTLLAFGFTAVLLVLATHPREEIRTLARIIAATFALSGLLSLIVVKGKHLSWLAFFVIAALVWAGQQ